MTIDYDVVVAGGGPSGLAATASLAEAGLSVACANPTQPPEWPNTYGIWVDELESLGLGGCAERTWASPKALFGSETVRELERPYALVDRDSLRARLRDRAESGDVAWLETAVTDVRSSDSDVTVQHRGGPNLSTRLVVDATGHRPVLAERPDRGSPGYQTAYGVEARCEPAPCADDEMVLMDYRDEHLSAREAEEGPSTFLYVMEVEPGRYLLEETTLVARPPVGYDRLERRLEKRIDHYGYDIDVLDSERVRIPMGLPVTPPDRERGIVAFGGSASLVHPATGYMVGRSLERAAPMAEAVATVLRSEADPSPGRAAEEAWRAVWPRDRRRARELLTFGMEVLIGMDARETADFFEAFFSLAREDWSDYMSGRIGAGRTASIMWRVFDTIGVGLKGRLTRAAFSRSGKYLVRSLTR